MGETLIRRPETETHVTGVGDGSTRRTVLRTGAVGLGVAGIAGTASGVTTNVTGGGTALQQAIEAANPGDRLVVRDGLRYDPIVVDKRLRIETQSGATIEPPGSSSVSPAVSIEADGVTLSGFTVRNPGELLGVKVGQGYDDATIENNTVENVGPTGSLGVTGVIVGQGDHDGITISNNTIRRLDQETTEDSGFPTVNGVLFDADNDNPGRLTNTAVVNNTVTELESDIAPLGIVIQHETNGVSIVNNAITDLTAADSTDSRPNDGVDFGFTFAQGINVASPQTASTTVVRNRIENVTSAETILPEAVKIDGDGGGVRFRANQFLVAIGLNNRNGTDGGNRDPSGDPVVDARNNYWGSPQGPEVAEFNQDADDDDRADVIGRVRFEPFLRRQPGRGGGGGPP